MSDFARGIMWCKVLAEVLQRTANRLETEQLEVGYRLACTEMLCAIDSQLEDLADLENQESSNEPDLESAERGTGRGGSPRAT